jgi:hypothetical protein
MAHTPKTIKVDMSAIWTLPPEPPEFGIRFTPAARRRIVEALKTTELQWLSNDSIEAILGAYADDPDDPDWRIIEEALTELLMPPVRYVAGLPEALCHAPGCPSAKMPGDYLCSEHRVADE